MSYLIAELGSVHMGNFRRIIEAIDRCTKVGIDALKLQLFPNEAPYVPTNIWTPPEMFEEAFRYARSKKLPLSASVFDQESFEFLMRLNPPFYKFAFSKKDQTKWIEAAIGTGANVYVSCDVMSYRKVPVDAVKLYCIPEYPVRYEIAFDEMFGPFDGFSDHTMGVRQTKRAIDAGAAVIEKHVRLGYDDETCPDAMFAVTIEEFGSVK